ncbi:hypothetical protein VNO80_18160 [Phaseolus coccineus]|uniref:Uncharacterized protein n=1 Tax=Phaseolus coccineus TaxID=3886 RepID=A0AAN9MIU6_PHACN
MLGCSECVIYQVANCPGFLSRGLSMMHKQMSGVLTWQQIAAACFAATTSDGKQSIVERKVPEKMMLISNSDACFGELSNQTVADDNAIVSLNVNIIGAALLKYN